MFLIPSGIEDNVSASERSTGENLQEVILPVRIHTGIIRERLVHYANALPSIFTSIPSNFFGFFAACHRDLRLWRDIWHC